MEGAAKLGGGGGVMSVIQVRSLCISMKWILSINSKSFEPEEYMQL